MIESNDEDAGFEDCVYGGMRPNYKIPILLTDMKEETLDGLFLEPSNHLCCAKCDFRFQSFAEMKGHLQTCSGEPNENGHATEYRASQYYTNMLILSLKELYEAGTSGIMPLEPREPVPFHMESIAELTIGYHNRVNLGRTLVTCRMCNEQFIHEIRKKKKHGYIDGVEDEWKPTLITDHVTECNEYETEFEKFKEAMDPFMFNVRYSYHKLFRIYELIRNGIYGSGFKSHIPCDPSSWRKITTIYEDDETRRKAELPKRKLLIRMTTLHHIEPEHVEFVCRSYVQGLDEVMDRIFFTRVTGLKLGEM
ncbi:unnamed protein product [Caenorhabditis brenneri]